MIAFCEDSSVSSCSSRFLEVPLGASSCRGHDDLLQQLPVAADRGAPAGDWWSCVPNYSSWRLVTVPDASRILAELVAPARSINFQKSSQWNQFSLTCVSLFLFFCFVFFQCLCTPSHPLLLSGPFVPNKVMLLHHKDWFPSASLGPPGTVGFHLTTIFSFLNDA